MLWNKTRFGKNIFAIGGNPEAAKVSMRKRGAEPADDGALGVFYAFGGLPEAVGVLVPATNNPRLYVELDAIAACVVGEYRLAAERGRSSAW